MDIQAEKLIKIEMHAHTSEVSPCAAVDAKAVVKSCKNAGYAAVVITDHFNNYVLHGFPGNNRQKVKRYLEGFEIAKETGESINIAVFFGIEVCLRGGPEDYLIYGVEKEFLFDHPTLYNLSQKELYYEAIEANALVYQAHPCRSYCRPKDPFLMHGVEVFNGNSLHRGPGKGGDNNNDYALKWALKYKHLLQISGSDIHHVEDIGVGGIALRDNMEVKRYSDLMQYLRLSDYKLIY